MTSSASASAGMALGDVKEVASILASPQRLSASIRAIFAAVGMNRASIWNPSRGPTSWMNSRFPAPVMGPLSKNTFGAQFGKGGLGDAGPFQHGLRVRAQGRGAAAHLARRETQLGHDARGFGRLAIREAGFKDHVPRPVVGILRDVAGVVDAA